MCFIVINAAVDLEVYEPCSIQKELFLVLPTQTWLKEMQILLDLVMLNMEVVCQSHEMKQKTIVTGKKSSLRVFFCYWHYFPFTLQVFRQYIREMHAYFLFFSFFNCIPTLNMELHIRFQ